MISKMGIPAYFSHIIKNYPEIIKNFKSNEFKVDNLFLDSNSIVYDSLREIEYKNDSDFEKKLITAVCKKLESYMQQINPNNLVYIAFDGVAPLAKLNQQKSRRYKSWFISNYENKNSKNNNDNDNDNDNYNYNDNKNKNFWDKTAITPGTDFMNKLNLQIKYHFKNALKFKVNKIIVSDSCIEGEGEHKIFEYIRKNTHVKDEINVIYGLDADLIMLTINHRFISEKMYLFRETPEFIKSLNSDLDPNKLYVMDIPFFTEKLNFTLNNNKTAIEEYEKNKIYDYIFLCFLLGNDFLPHFPAINIRTKGIDLLLNIYQEIIGNKKQNIIKNGKIIWKNFRKIIQELSNVEEELIQKEHKNRDKQEKRPPYIDKNDKKLSLFDKEMLHVPIKSRELEKYINPFEKGWQYRYYDMILDISNEEKNFEDKIKNLCLNYIEGLEWTFKYYMTDCADWRWFYKYDYPPLIRDLLKYLPYFETDLIQNKPKNPIKDVVQLSYVLPKNSLLFLPKKVKNILEKNYGYYYQENYDFKWAYCKYFWESHVEFPRVDFEEFEKNILQI